MFCDGFFKLDVLALVSYAAQHSRERERLRAVSIVATALLTVKAAYAALLRLLV